MLASLARSLSLVTLAGCSLYFGERDPDREHSGDDSSPDEAPPDEGKEEGTSPSLVPIATDEPGIYEMAADSTHVYWVDNGQFDYEANVRRMPLGGGPIETIFSAPERIYSLAVSDGFVYAVWTGAGYAGQIYRVPAAGGVATSIGMAFNPTSITVDGSWVYYSEAISPGGRILRVPTTGGTPEVVVDDVDNPWDLVASGGVLFYSEMNVGRMMRVVPGETPVPLASGWIGTGWMTVDETDVYFSACAGGSCEQPRLYRVARNGGPLTELAIGKSPEAKLSVAGDNVQWSAMAASTHGGPPKPLITDDTYPIAVVATSSSYYFADFYTGKIFRAPL